MEKTHCSHDLQMPTWPHNHLYFHITKRNLHSWSYLSIRLLRSARHGSANFVILRVWVNVCMPVSPTENLHYNAPTMHVHQEVDFKDGAGGMTPGHVQVQNLHLLFFVKVKYVR